MTKTSPTPPKGKGKGRRTYGRRNTGSRDAARQSKARTLLKQRVRKLENTLQAIIQVYGLTVEYEDSIVQSSRAQEEE